MKCLLSGWGGGRASSETSAVGHRFLGNSTQTFPKATTAALLWNGVLTLSALLWSRSDLHGQSVLEGFFWQGVPHLAHAHRRCDYSGERRGKKLAANFSMHCCQLGEVEIASFWESNDWRGWRCCMCLPWLPPRGFGATKSCKAMPQQLCHRQIMRWRCCCTVHTDKACGAPKRSQCWCESCKSEVRTADFLECNKACNIVV